MSQGCKCLYVGIDDARQDVGTTGKVVLPSTHLHAYFHIYVPFPLFLHPLKIYKEHNTGT